MLDLLCKKHCWNGGFTKSNGLTQGHNISDIHRNASEDSKNGSKGRWPSEAWSFSINSSTAKRIPSIEDPLEDSDLQPHLLMHHGMPATSCVVAYDPVQHMLAIATQDGRIKVFGAAGLENFLQSSKQSPIRFLQFLNNQGLLVSTNAENDIEVWDISTVRLVGSQKWEKDVTALAVIQDTIFLYIGDASGTISVLQYDRKGLEVNVTAYIIKLFGDFAESYDRYSVIEVLPQPSAEHERVLLCYANGLCILWALHDGKVLAARAHTQSQLEVIVGTGKQHKDMGKQLSEHSAREEEEEIKNITCVCWSCPKGTIFATGYSDGDIWLWALPQTLRSKVSEDDAEHINVKYSSIPLCKLTFAVPVTMLRWWESDESKQEKNGYLYALGGKNKSGHDVLKIISLKDARSLKSNCSVELSFPGHFTDCLLIHTLSKAQFIIISLGSEGKLYAYDVKEVYQSFKNSVDNNFSSLIRPVLVDFPLLESRVTTTKTILLNRNGNVANHLMQVPRFFGSYFSYQSAELDENCFLYGCNQTEALTDSKSRGCYLYITGHENGSVHFWDLSTHICSICSLQSQEYGQSLSGQSPVSALDFCSITGFLATGYANGLISVYRLNVDLQKSSSGRHSNEGDKMKLVDWTFISKFHTHQASICCIVISSPCHRLAAGSEIGMISLIDLETNALIYNGRSFPSIISGIVSFNFVSISTSQHVFSCCGSPLTPCAKKKHLDLKTSQILVVTTKDSQVFILDAQSGACHNTTPLKPKNPSNAISMHILDVSGNSLIVPAGYHSQLLPETSPFEESENTPASKDLKMTYTALQNIVDGASTSGSESWQYLLLLCAEDALRIYHMSSIFKGVCSPSLKIRLDSTCCWASTFQTPTNRIGLILVYKTGKIELRCFPDLNVLKSTHFEGFLKWKIEPSLSFFKIMSCTVNGQIALVDHDSELLFLSILDVKHDLRFPRLSSTSPKVVTKVTENLMDIDLNKKKKKPFGRVLKAKNVLLKVSDKGNEPTSQKVLDLEQLFTGKSSRSSPPLQSSHHSYDESHSDCSSLHEISSNSLGIDDIEVEDEEPPKDGIKTPNRRNLINKVKKKFKVNEKIQKPVPCKQKPQRLDLVNELQNPDADLSPVNRARTIDEIKATYGQGKEQNVTGVAAGLRDKLLQQRHKIQAIDKRTAEMQEGAQNFHMMAEELVKAIQERNTRRFL